MGQTSPAQTKPKQDLQGVLRYVVGRGFRVLWFCDGDFCPCGMNTRNCEKDGVYFIIGNTVVAVFEGKDEYQVYINDYGPVYLKEISDETLRQAANEIVRRLTGDLKF